MNSLFNIVLVEPEIPNNTGNIGRTCVATQCHLHLVGPLGFEISDKQLKRSGLDYWDKLTWSFYENYSQFVNLKDLRSMSSSRQPIYFSAHAKKSFFDYTYMPGDYLVFGKETKGLDPEIIYENQDSSVYIPTPGQVRSLNLATTVAIAIYEGYRQVQSRQKIF